MSNNLKKTTKLKTELLNNYSDIYTQYDLEFDNFKVVLTTGISNQTNHDQSEPNKSRSAIIILSGLNTYYFHHHLKNYLPNYDFFIIDPPARGFNINYSYKNTSIPDSYIDNMDITYTYIKKTIEYLASDADFNLNNSKYDNIYIFGHSTGSLLALYFVSRYEKESDQIKNFKIDRICLDSPLTDTYMESTFGTIIIKYFVKFLCMFSKKININYGLFQPGLINLINSLSKEIPALEAYEVDTNYQKEMSESVIYTGIIKFIMDVNNYLQTNKITTEIRMVCSRNYSKDEFNVVNYLSDNFINPTKAISDIKSFVADTKNFKYKQYISGHGCLMKPKNGFITDGYDYTHVADFLFGNM